ncbi:MAG: hypothetical protein AB7P07_05880 [Hyphomonadaceae bacterium]
MRIAAAMLAAVFMLSACASVQRQLSYTNDQPDADIYVGGYRYAAWFHPSDPTLLLQRGAPHSLGRALVQNWTVYSNDASEPSVVWRAAADAVLQPIGCQTTEITGADQIREITYSCMQGVNVMAAVGQYRQQWRQGVRVDDPTQRQSQPSF